MWTHEHSMETSASPTRVWALLSDVPGWKRWNAGIEEIHMHGPFAEGTTFTMKPPGEDAFTSTLIEVAAYEVFVDETIIDGTRVLVAHRIVPLASGRTRVTYSTEITGPAADMFGPMVTADFPDVLNALKQLAEQTA
ncbi:SRPBCC family protein [Dyella subtropica]|uniref:SRPBCC family protein n=1 Tax=Dyella subtropica TaxID=2992127 RepID=UPI0022576C15|nr:SRPBCC family protein [Dyella subtropica]